jgi:hypothetical protein
VPRNVAIATESSGSKLPMSSTSLTPVGLAASMICTTTSGSVVIPPWFSVNNRHIQQFDLSLR